MSMVDVCQMYSWCMLAAARHLLIARHLVMLNSHQLLICRHHPSFLKGRTLEDMKNKVPLSI